MKAYITCQVHKLWPVILYSRRMHLLKWNKLHEKSYEPSPQCKRKLTISNIKQSGNVRMCIVKWKVYMCINQIPLILYTAYYRSKVVSRVEMMGTHYGQLRVPVRANQATISDQESATGSEGLHGVVRKLRISGTNSIHRIETQNGTKQNKMKRNEK